jgi:hypothetical protein
MLTIADLAWTAGIIDGEGSIFVMKQKREDRDRDTNYILRVSVQSTDPHMTSELKAMFPDGAEFSVAVDKRENNSNTMKWQVSGRRAAKFLKEILPFMRVKHKQAELAVEFQTTTKKHWRHMLPEDYKKQEMLYLALKQAKKDLKIGKENLNGC